VLRQCGRHFRSGHPLASTTGGIADAGSLPGLSTLPGQTALSAANTAEALPFADSAIPESLLAQIAALGSEGTATGTSTTSMPVNLGTTLLGGGLGLLSLLGANPGTTSTTNPTTGAVTSGTTGGAGLLGLLSLSDERSKEDIVPIGLLHNGLNVYKFKYRHDPKHETHVGLIAQEVEDVAPHAVGEFGDTGYKGVDYDLATDPNLGIWRHAA
jgi:Chaperone of endosialidase